MLKAPLHVNVAESFISHAAKHPDAIAFKIPQGFNTSMRFKTILYGQFAQSVTALAAHLQQAGIGPTTRVLVLAPPGEVFVRSIYALFVLGAVPICIDPGMGRKKFLACIKHISPQGLIATPKALMLARLLAGSMLKAIPLRYCISSKPRLAQAPQLHYAEANTLGAIVFTSGSTGAPKAVPYTRANMLAQVDVLERTYGFSTHDVDLPLLNAFSLFNPALGCTTVVPAIDPRRPAATLKPAQLWATLEAAGVTRSFGAPRLWSMIAQHAHTHHLSNLHIQQIHLAGAAVPKALVKALMQIFPAANIHTPYGATEALPVTTLTGTTILALNTLELANGSGVCVGKPVSGIEVKVIPIQTGPVSQLPAPLPAHTVGEIIVKGPTVSQSYLENAQATQLAKIPTAAGLWHRMGDLGYADDQGQLWLCGRVAERVTAGALHWDTQPAEDIFNLHPDVSQAALIGLGPVGNQTPAVAVTLKRPGLNFFKRKSIYKRLHQWAQAHAYTQSIHTFFIVPRMPVDVRHNTKIHRLALARTLHKRWLRIRPNFGCGGDVLRSVK